MDRERPTGLSTENQSSGGDKCGRVGSTRPSTADKCRFVDQTPDERSTPSLALEGHACSIARVPRFSPIGTSRVRESSEYPNSTLHFEFFGNRQSTAKGNPCVPPHSAGSASQSRSDQLPLSTGIRWAFENATKVRNGIRGCEQGQIESLDRAPRKQRDIHPTGDGGQ